MVFDQMVFEQMDFRSFYFLAFDLVVWSPHTHGTLTEKV
jgi:hypothetical protein